MLSTQKEESSSDNRAERVVNLAKPQEPPELPKKILVAIDGSENSMRALETSKLLAKVYKSELEMLSVLQTPVSVIGNPSMNGVFWDEYFAKGKAETEKWLDQLVKSAEEEGIEACAKIVEESPSVVGSIVDTAQAEDADLIVIGTRGLGGFRRLVLGSVSSGIAEHAHCDVLVVR